MFPPTFLDQSVEHLLAWDVNLSHTNVNLLNTKMLYRKSVRQNYISNVKLFDRLTLILFDRFSGKIFQQIYMCDRFTPWFSVQQICKLAKLSVQICWTNQLMVDAVLCTHCGFVRYPRKKTYLPFPELVVSFSEFNHTNQRILVEILYQM